MARARKKEAGRKAKRQGGRFGRVMLVAALVGAVALAAFAFVGYMVVRGYLHSEKFRALVGDETSKALEAEGGYETFEWEGKSAYTKSFSADGYEGAFFSRLKAHEIRARVSLAGVRRGVWEIPHVQIDRLDFVVSNERIEPEAEDVNGADEASGGGGGGLFSRLIPSEVEIQQLEVKKVNFNVLADGRETKARNLVLTMKPTSARDGYALTGHSGNLLIAGLPELRLDDFNVHFAEDRAYVDHVALRLYDSARVQLSGEAALAKGSLVDLNGVLEGLELEDVLQPDIAQKFKGLVGGDFNLKSRPQPDGSLVVSGRLGLRDGSLEAMPVLQRIDTLAGTTRFRKLNFTQVEVAFEKRGDELALDEVLFESAGLVCLKGRMVRSESGVPTGMYMLGVSPDTIKWMPVVRKQVVDQVFRTERDAAFAQVFPRAESDDIALPPDGYRWAVVTIDPGSPDPYTADIRRQFIDAGGLAIWAELQGMPERVVKAAGEVAKVAGDQGVDLIGMLAKEGFGTDSLLLSEGLVEKLGEGLQINDLFEEGTAIPKSIINSGIDVINDLNPLTPRRE